MKRFAISADLGGTNLRVAVVEESGRMLEKVAVPTRVAQGRERVIRDLCTSVREMAEKFQGQGSLAGIGIGIPGIIYLETGTLRQSPNLPGWENYPVRDEIESLLGMRVLLDNDANVAALGEKWLGAGRDVDSLCMLTLGTGVGGGLVLDGKIWHGFLGMAGELGHIVVAEDGVACPCGGRGCLETEASASAVVRKAKQLLATGKSPALAKACQSDGVRHSPFGIRVPDSESRFPSSDPTAELVYETASAGDAACREVFDSVGKYLGIGFAGLINTLNLPLYVIGGGAAGAWELFAPAMFRVLRERSYIFCEGRTRVEKSILAGDAGLYGAAYLVFQAGTEKGAVTSDE